MPPANSSGVSLELLPSVVILDGKSGVATTNGVTFTLTPPRADMKVGTAFVQDDRAYVGAGSNLSSFSRFERACSC
jgi:hypothetical protein